MANSHSQYSVRECRANLQSVVFWATRRLRSDDDCRYTLNARRERSVDLLLVPYLYGWNWRLHDGRRVFFQPDLQSGLGDMLDAFDHFDEVRARFKRLPLKATRRVIGP